jgi:superfamily II DNA or RNA helicase
VDEGAWRRGLAYFRDGMVDSVEVFETPGGHRELFGDCSGSRGAFYEQEIAFVSTGNDVELVGHCSCPVGFNCKHVVAVVLEWQRRGYQFDDSPIDPVDQWLETFIETDSKSPDDREEALLYQIRRHERFPSIVDVDFRVAKPRANGEGWTLGRNAATSTLYNPWSSSHYLTDADQEILGLIRASAMAKVSDRGLTGAVGGLALGRMVDTGRCFLESDRVQAIRRGPDRMLHIAWQRQAEAFSLKLELEDGGELLDVDPPMYLDIDRFLVGAVQYPEGLDTRHLIALSQAPQVPKDRAAAVARRLALSVPAMPTPVPVQRLDVGGRPVPVLRVDFDPRVPQFAVAHPCFAYEDQRVDPGGEAVLVREEEVGLVRIERDLVAEEQALKQLEGVGLVPLHGRTDQFVQSGWKQDVALRDTWFAWIDQQKPRLEQAGWQVELVEQQGVTVSQADGIHGEVEESGNDWFSLRFDLEFDGWVMPLLPLVSELLGHYQPGELPETLYLNAGKGHFVKVPSARIEPVLATIIELFDRVDGDTLELPRPDAARLNDLDGIPIQGATSLRKLAAQLRDFSGLATVKLPTTFKGELRPYQQHGVDWLQFLRQHGFGGILADDMGLGKTVQTLAHLAVEKRAGRMKHPCLIVAPTSLMSNWQREAATFTPKLQVLVLQGQDRFERFEQIDRADLVLTTYPLLPRDRKWLLAQSWHYLILDEAQQIKNPKAQAAQVARRLKAEHRLCLTGTPMENHLSELWAQFDFLMPGFLGEHQEFRRHYRTPIEQHGDGARLQRLTQRTAPFMLRRTKDLVAAELPPKTELLRTVSLEEQQAMLYESVRLTMERKVRQSIANRGLARSHIIVLDALLKLRQVCCDPRLLPSGTRGASKAGSAKLELLFDLLPEMIEEGRRVLLFSQFTTMLGLIESEVNQRGIAYSKLTGQTRKRDVAIERFRSGQANLFLISLKAGGVGLNLTEADTVIHYDPWWNPAVEHQATDRAHRIGQDKPVFVYKLVAEGTVEERILALQERKQHLADQVYGAGRAQDEPPIDEATIEALLAAV